MAAVEFSLDSAELKEQYTVTAHAPNFDFWTRCREIKICEESKRTFKNPFVSRLAEFSTTLKLLRITYQWYIVPVKFRFGRNWDFLALLLLPLAGGPKDGERFGVDWRLISSASFHTSSDNSESNTRKWNSKNKDCKKYTIETLMWLRRSCAIKLRKAQRPTKSNKEERTICLQKLAPRNYDAMSLRAASQIFNKTKDFFESLRHYLRM